MNENINLCELLKDHVEETFYSSAYGDVTLYDIIPNNPYPIVIQIPDSEGFFLRSLTKDGKLYEKRNVECILFPSEYQRDWNKWAEEQKPKVSKTWNEMQYFNAEAVTKAVRHFIQVDNMSPIEKSALALLKIHQLIEVGYGGNITNEEWENDHLEKVVIRANHKGVLYQDVAITRRHPIAFHTREQEVEFLSHLENVQLVKDFYMIP